jgi:hypothetical protein
MTAARLPLIIEQGATWKHALIVRASRGGPPRDLTGHTARMQIRKVVTSADVLAELSVANNGIIITAAEGRIDLVLSATATAGLPPGPSVYDIELEAPSGEVTRLLQGTVTVDAQVTR